MVGWWRVPNSAHVRSLHYGLAVTGDVIRVGNATGGAMWVIMRTTPTRLLAQQARREVKRGLARATRIDTMNDVNRFVPVVLENFAMGTQKAVVFDMDGVLMDSFTPHFESWRAMFAEYGYDITLDDFTQTFGKTSRETIPLLVPNLTNEQIHEMDLRKEFLYRELIAHKFPTMPGISELLNRLRTWHYAVAIGSSGPRENVEQAAHLLDPNAEYFDAIANGSDVQRGKPAPDVFLLALKRLQTKFPTLTAADCVVVEDSPLGVAAAHAAGMHAIGFASRGRTHEELVHANHIIDSPDEITLPLLQSLSCQPDR